MAVEGDTERALFFDSDEFGTTGTYTPSGGSSSSILGIFDNDYMSADIGTNIGVGTSNPSFICRTADVASAANGDALVVNSVTYTVRNVEDDGTGITTLMLEV